MLKIRRGGRGDNLSSGANCIIVASICLVVAVAACAVAVWALVENKPVVQQDGHVEGNLLVQGSLEVEGDMSVGGVGQLGSQASLPLQPGAQLLLSADGTTIETGTFHIVYHVDQRPVELPRTGVTATAALSSVPDALEKLESQWGDSWSGEARIFVHGPLYQVAANERWSLANLPGTLAARSVRIEASVPSKGILEGAAAAAVVQGTPTALPPTPNAEQLFLQFPNSTAPRRGAYFLRNLDLPRDSTGQTSPAVPVVPMAPASSYVLAASSLPWVPLATEANVVMLEPYTTVQLALGDLELAASANTQLVVSGFHFATTPSDTADREVRIPACPSATTVHFESCDFEFDMGPAGATLRLALHAPHKLGGCTLWSLVPSTSPTLAPASASHVSVSDESTWFNCALGDIQVAVGGLQQVVLWECVLRESSVVTGENARFALVGSLTWGMLRTQLRLDGGSYAAIERCSMSMEAPAAHVAETLNASTLRVTATALNGSGAAGSVALLAAKSLSRITIDPNCEYNWDGGTQPLLLSAWYGSRVIALASSVAPNAYAGTQYQVGHGEVLGDLSTAALWPASHDPVTTDPPVSTADLSTMQTAVAV